MPNRAHLLQASTLSFQEEPRNKGRRDLADQELSVAEISALLNDEEGHGLCNYLQEKCWYQVSSGNNLENSLPRSLVRRVRLV